MSSASGNSLGELGDVSPEDFRRQLHEVADWIADYREQIADRPISPNADPGAIVRALPERAPESGEEFAEIWRDFEQLIVPGMVHWGHPQFMGYFGSTTTAPGILAEMAAAALNVNAMTWRTSPAATELETVVLNWLRQWLGLPAGFQRRRLRHGFDLDDARARRRARARPSTRFAHLAFRGEVALLRVYASDHAHSSVEKAAIALGIGENNVRRVASDCGIPARSSMPCSE